MDTHVKDKMVLWLSYFLTWESPYLDRPSLFWDGDLVLILVWSKPNFWVIFGSLKSQVLRLSHPIECPIQTWIFACAWWCQSVLWQAKISAKQLEPSCEASRVCNLSKPRQIDQWVLLLPVLSTLLCTLCLRTNSQKHHTNYILNSLWPGDAIWRHGTRSALAQVMAWCLTAPSHYLNQCWLISGEFPCIHLRALYSDDMKIENCCFKMASRGPSQ